MSLLRVGLRSILQSAAKTRVAVPIVKSARCLTILSNNTTTKTPISSSLPSLMTPHRNYGAHATDYDDKVKEFLMLFDKIDPSKIANEAKLCADLGLDSLDIVEVAIMLADEFCLDISDVEMDTMHDFTVQDLITFTSSKCDF